MTTASRKREVFCSKCDELAMERTKLSFDKYAKMDEIQRQDYSKSWLYIHNAGKRSSS
jgi:hypothetical protein